MEVEGALQHFHDTRCERQVSNYRCILKANKVMICCRYPSVHSFIRSKHKPVIQDLNKRFIEGEYFELTNC